VAGQSLTFADSALKDFYVGPIVEQINQKTYCIDQIERDSDHIAYTGRRAVVPVHKNRNRGRASIAEGGNLPKAKHQTWLDAVIPIREHVYTIELSDLSIEATKSDEGAFISLMEAETKGVAIDMRKDINRQGFGEGTGLLGTCGTTAGSTEMVMNSAFDTQYIREEDLVDVIEKSNGATGTGHLETEVTKREVGGSHKITITNSVTTTTSFGVYVHGNRNLEMDGLRNMTSKERTLHSIDSTQAGNAIWDGNVQEVGTSLTELAVAGESSFEKLADEVGARGNGDVEVFLTTRGIRRRLADSYQSQKRFNDDKAVDVHGGYSAIMVNEIPVIADDDCPKTYAFGFNKSAFKWFELVKPGFMQKGDGGIFQLQSAGTGQWSSNWVAFFVWYASFGCVAPNRTGQLKYCSDDNPLSGER
jgi:hypothetical protein